MLLAVSGSAHAACPTEPAFDPAVPSWEKVNGFELGSRQATYAEVVTYLDALGLDEEQLAWPAAVLVSLQEAGVRPTLVVL